MYSVTLNPLYALRILSTVLSITAFIIFVIDGGDAFIAADIFLAFTFIYNILILIQHSITHIFKITVELRSSSEPWRHDIGSTRRKVKPNMYIDVGLAVCLIICLIIGDACVNRYHGGGAWQAAVVLGWFVVIIQIMLAVPTLDKKSLTLSAKFNDLGSKEPEDTKYMVPNSATTGSADMGAATRRGGTPGEEPRTMAEDLV